MERMHKILIGVAVMVLTPLLVLLGFRLFFVKFVDNYEFAIMFDRSTGKIEPVIDSEGNPKIGYIVYTPILMSVKTIDTRPFQVKISANNRVLNAKLIRFNPRTFDEKGNLINEGWREFISYHGLKDYEINNGSYEPSSGSFEDILKAYDYDPSNKSYSFLEIKKQEEVNGQNNSIYSPKDSLNNE